ncbi:alpha/beta fold hydrolase [Pseudoroseomonas wenyumeiae]
MAGAHRLRPAEWHAGLRRRHAEALVLAGRAGSEGPGASPVHEMVLNTPENGFVACAQALQSYDIHGALPGLRQPVLLIAGEKDGAMPRSMQELAGIIPDAFYVEIPGAGHLPCIEEPEAFNTAMRRFLDEKLASADPS